MAENRGLIITGAALLVIVLLIGAFSLGVYLGHYGLSPEGLRYVPPRTDLQAARRLARPKGFPQGDPDIVGIIRQGSREGIELATQAGPKWIVFDPDTVVAELSGNILTLRDLRPGDLIAVFGELTIDDGNSLHATHIARLPPR